jgi:hypothetical protein
MAANGGDVFPEFPAVPVSPLLPLHTTLETAPFRCHVNVEHSRNLLLLIM